MVATLTDRRYQAAYFQECHSNRNGAISKDHHSGSDIHELLSHSGALLPMVARLTTLTSCRYQELTAQECRSDKRGVIPQKPFFYRPRGARDVKNCTGSVKNFKPLGLTPLPPPPKKDMSDQKRKFPKKHMSKSD